MQTAPLKSISFSAILKVVCITLRKDLILSLPSLVTFFLFSFPSLINFLPPSRRKYFS